ncbi:nucleolar and coiled-body phosphoprotein 1 [Aplysia californica]|uniref:Nucleolar and coiled-body phosphoprotein 1 n=1 Tax=Aplysia californica TaxID=6500 RepID=A0ABM0JMX7_APLCA|nr:nucleolar and coiled-body phosphoprotein 1 [Aplysia californica]
MSRRQSKTVSTITTTSFYSSSSSVQVTPGSASSRSRLTLDSSGDSPHWISGHESLFSTPKSLSPLKTRRKTTVVHTEIGFSGKGTPSKNSSQRKVGADEFKVPSLMFSSPPGVKTRSRRSSIYVSTKQASKQGTGESSRRHSTQPQTAKVQKQTAAVKRAGKKSNAKTSTTKITAEKVLLVDNDKFDPEVSFNMKSLALSPNVKENSSPPKKGKSSKAKSGSGTEIVKSVTSKTLLKKQKASSSPKVKKITSRSSANNVKVKGTNVASRKVTKSSSRSAKKVVDEEMEVISDQDAGVDGFDGSLESEGFTSLKAKTNSPGRKGKAKASKSPRGKSPKVSPLKNRKQSPSPPRKVRNSSRRLPETSETFESLTEVTTETLSTPQRSAKRAVSQKSTKKSRAGSKSPSKSLGSSSPAKAKATRGKRVTSASASKLESLDTEVQAEDESLLTPVRGTSKKTGIKSSSSKSRKSKGNTPEIGISVSSASTSSSVETQISASASKRQRSRSKTPLSKSSRKSAKKEAQASSGGPVSKSRRLSGKTPQSKSPRKSAEKELASSPKGKVLRNKTPKGKSPVVVLSYEITESPDKSLPRDGAEKFISPGKNKPKSSSKSKEVSVTPKRKSTAVSVSSSRKSQTSTSKRASKSPRKSPQRSARAGATPRTQKQLSGSRTLNITLETTGDEIISGMSKNKQNTSPRIRKTPKSNAADVRVSLEVSKQRSASKSAKSPVGTPPKSTQRITVSQHSHSKVSSLSNSSGRQSLRLNESPGKTRDAATPLVISERYRYPQISLSQVNTEKSSLLKSSTPYVYSHVDSDLRLPVDAPLSSVKRVAGSVETVNSTVDESSVGGLFSPLSRAGISSSLRRTVLRTVPALDRFAVQGSEYSASKQTATSGGIEYSSEITGSGRKRTTLAEIDTLPLKRSRLVDEEKEIDKVIGAMFSHQTPSLVESSSSEVVTESHTRNILYAEPEGKETVQARSYSIMQSGKALSGSYHNGNGFEAIDGKLDNEENEDDEEEEEEEEENGYVSYQTQSRNLRLSKKTEKNEEEEEEEDEEEEDEEDEENQESKYHAESFESNDADMTLVHSSQSQRCTIL